MEQPRSSDRVDRVDFVPGKLRRGAKRNSIVARAPQGVIRWRPCLKLAISEILLQVSIKCTLPRFRTPSVRKGSYRVLKEIYLTARRHTSTSMIDPSFVVRDGRGPGLSFVWSCTVGAEWRRVQVSGGRTRGGGHGDRIGRVCACEIHYNEQHHGLFSSMPKASTSDLVPQE